MCVVSACLCMRVCVCVCTKCACIWLLVASTKLGVPQEYRIVNPFTRVNRYRRRGIEHQKHSTKQTLSKQGCDYNKTLPCYYAFHKRADTAKFKADKMSKHELQLLTGWRDPYAAKTSNCAALRVPLKFSPCSFTILYPRVTTHACFSVLFRIRLLHLRHAHCFDLGLLSRRTIRPLVFQNLDV